MKTRTIIEELSQEDLVNLFSTATYGSSWLDITAPETTGADIKEDDCLEDKWAKALLAGHKVKCFDYYAEGERYGNLGGVIKKDGTAVYFVGLEEIKKGLQKCLDGDIQDGGKWLKECVAHFMAGAGEMDQPEAEALMQVIMFNELIYG